MPTLDLLLIATIQLMMLKALAEEYDLPFSASRGKALVSALVGGYLPTRLACGGVGSLLKAVPGVGIYVGLVTVPIFATASTYAVGQVFIQHFESGGTFLDFDPQAVRAHFEAELKKREDSSVDAA